MVVDLRRDMDTAAAAVNRIELVRSQIEALSRVIDDAPIKKAGDELNQKFIDLEMNLDDLRLTGAQDGVRYAAKLISRIGYLASGLSSGDFEPTSQQVEVQKLLEERLQGHSSRVDELVTKDLAAFNEMLRQRGIPNIVVSPR